MCQRKDNRKRLWLFIVIVLAVILLLLLKAARDAEAWRLELEVQTPEIATFAAENDLSVYEYPDELIKLMQNNPETEDFVLNYPLKKDEVVEFTLEECEDCDSVPLLMQWDARWGYTRYASELMGISGCGPTCLSMVCIYLLGDTSYDPAYIAQFSEENGFFDRGNGSKWTLVSEGGELLGLDVTEIPLDEDRIIRNLEAGNPIICVMGPGDFTTTGHFIVMTGFEDGMIAVNDPNSKARSEKLWAYDDISDQIRNLWVCRIT